MGKSGIWLSDIHLDHLGAIGFDHGLNILKHKVLDLLPNPEFIVVSGDNSTALNVCDHMERFADSFYGIPIYFVLGNHDFYGSSIEEVRRSIVSLTKNVPNLFYLTESDPIALTENTIIAGHDGWYDGGYSDWFQSRLIMNDYYEIEDFIKIANSKHAVFDLINKLSKQGAKKLVDTCTKAFPDPNSHSKSLLFVTHVPPFPELSLAPTRQRSDSNWLPVMASKHMGDALKQVSNHYQGIDFQCLSGHTHTSTTERYGYNLTCSVAHARYGAPWVSIATLNIK